MDLKITINQIESYRIKKTVNIIYKKSNVVVSDVNHLFLDKTRAK